MTKGVRRGVAAVVGLALVTACSPPGAPDQGPDQVPSASNRPEADAVPPESGAGLLPTVHTSVSLPALMAEEFEPSRLERTDHIADDLRYATHAVSYRSEGLRISGTLLVPTGPGPFPAVVLAHGYSPPERYRSGKGLWREQRALADAGYVVLTTDYRGYGASDPSPRPWEGESRIGYTSDVIAAVLALQQEEYVDPDRIALLGRSMGGGVAYNVLVTRPGLVRAAVIYGAMSSRFEDNLDRFTLRSRPELAEELFSTFGTPEESPRFYEELSPRTYFDRITEPVLLHHGTSDNVCPLAWSSTSQALLEAAGVESTLAVYEGESHAFTPRWQDSMDRTLAFLEQHLATV